MNRSRQIERVRDGAVEGEGDGGLEEVVDNDEGAVEVVEGFDDLVRREVHRPMMSAARLSVTSTLPTCSTRQRKLRIEEARHTFQIL